MIYKNEETKRNKKLVKDVLLTQLPLVEIAKTYGISKQRVEQIFQKKTTFNAGYLRDQFLASSPKFRCLVCGNRLTDYQIRLGKAYCSLVCFSLTKKYDLVKPQKCQNCKKEFFRYRHSKYMKFAHKYCSMDCYRKASSIRGMWSRQFRKFIKRKTGYQKTCLNCGKKFRTSFRTQKFDTHDCYWQYRQKNKEKYRRNK